MVALDPRTGEILALVSFPTYDPNLLAHHDTAAADGVPAAPRRGPDKPRLARSYQDRFFPGSTFKVVTATAGILYGGVTADEPVYPREQRLPAPQHDPSDPQLRRLDLRRRALRDPPRRRATRPSPRWASTPAPTP